MARRDHDPAGGGQDWQHRLLKISAIVTAVVTLLCCALMVAATQGWLTGTGRVTISTPETTAPETTAPATEPPPDTVIHFVAGGDLNITDATVAAGASGGGYDYTSVFLDVLPVLSGADVTALNLEGILGGEPYGSDTASAPQALAQALAAAGVDIVQTANSYSIINGLSGLRATLQGIQDAGMTPLGTYASNADFEESGGYVVWDIQGIRVAFVAFTKGMDGMGLPTGSENCVNLLYTDYNSTYQTVDTAGITSILRAVQQSEPDVVIALLHWGSEFNNVISSTQEAIVSLMFSEGVDAIVGTHSHYVQKMVLDEENGTFVAYSLGDFFGDAEKSGTGYSVLLDLEITKDGSTGETRVTAYDYIPIYIETSEEDGAPVRVLRIREAIEGYESASLGRVSEATYTAMVSALSRIESRVAAD